MARPIEFEYDKVLSNALAQFWKEGYEASSIQKLLDCTAINRGTLYNSFGDKHTFFQACVGYYNDELARTLNDSLGNASLSAWDAMDRFFKLTLIDVPARQRAMGCVLVNSLCESINYDRELKKLVRQSLAVIRKGFLQRVREAQDKGSLRKGLDSEFAADLLMNALHGMRVNSRDGADANQLQQLVDFTLQSIRKNK